MVTRPILSRGRSDCCRTGLALTPAVQMIVSASNSWPFDSTTCPSTHELRNVEKIWIRYSSSLERVAAGFPLTGEDARRALDQHEPRFSSCSIWL